MSSKTQTISRKKNELHEIGPGFWNVRGHFRVFAKMIDIGTQMSIVKLSNGNFVIFDTVELNDRLKQQIDQLTDNGNLIEGVIGTHPSHTRSFLSFYRAYPQAAYYGTPKHLKSIPEIPWLGSLGDCNVRKKWEPDIEMRIPAGGEFINPDGASNHLIGVFVYHPRSRTLHIDDTLNYTDKFGLLLKLFGCPDGALIFHTSIKTTGLHPTAEAPYLFRDSLVNMLLDWSFDNLCCAHLDVKLGGAHALLRDLLNKSEPLFTKLSSQKGKKNPSGELPTGYNDNTDVTGDECG